MSIVPFVGEFEDILYCYYHRSANQANRFGKIQNKPIGAIELEGREKDGVYERNRIELLRDVFAWAYERSCQQYLAVRRELVPPDTFRLRYRQKLGETIKAIILQLQAPTKKAVMAFIPYSMPEEDHDKFLKLVLEEFENLHEGNAIRFGVRPQEFAAWQEKSSSRKAPMERLRF